MKWIAIRVLCRRLGCLRGIGVGLRVTWAEARGEPWRRLPSSRSEAEELSRRQIGGAILLYRVLLGPLEGEAYALTREVVLRSSTPWMRYAVGRFDLTSYRNMSAENRKVFLWAKTRAFFNMTISRVHAEEEEAGFVVEACHLPGLCRLAGVPELAPLFCEVDAHYFGGVERDLELDRPRTIASGDPCCDFTFRFTPVGDQRIRNAAEN